MTREEEYKKTVISEARYALTELIEVAVYKNYEVDTFVRHVLDELNKMYKSEVEE